MGQIRAYTYNKHNIFFLFTEITALFNIMKSCISNFIQKLVEFSSDV